MSDWGSPEGNRVKGALLGFVGGAVFAALLSWSVQAEEAKPQEPTLVERLAALEKRAEEQERRRCLSDKPEFTVYMVPNLGVHKVAKP